MKVLTKPRNFIEFLHAKKKKTKKKTPINIYQQLLNVSGEETVNVISVTNAFQ